MKYKIFAILIMASFLASSCEFLDGSATRIYIVNHTNKKIGYQFSYRNPVPEDTLLQRYLGIRGVKAYSSDTLWAPTMSDWKQELSDGSYLQILILDTDVYSTKLDHDKYNWNDPDLIDTLRNDVTVLQRYNLSTQDLEELHYIISYPPTEEMRNVIMWPPYQESIQSGTAQ
jgi:hypothetical protein